MRQGSQNSRLEQLDALSAAVVQELKNPLSTIVMTLALLREELAGRKDEASNESLRRVEALVIEAGRMERIIGDFVRLQREPELSLAPVDLNSLIEDAVASVQADMSRRNVTSVLQLDRRLKPVDIDPAWFRQALMSFLHNALQAMDGGGTLTAQTFTTAATIELRVIDTGRGIDPAFIPRVFDAFSSTRPGAQGVGLCLARRIVEQHGGTVRCESAVGLGTRILVTLPIPGAAGGSS